MDLTWSEGVDTTDLYAYEAGHILASDVASATTVAMRGDAVSTIRGLQDHTDGANIPIVYIPRLPHLTTANNTIKLNRCGGVVYGRMVGGITEQSLLSTSTEEEDEVIRFNLTISEEV